MGIKVDKSNAKIPKKHLKSTFNIKDFFRLRRRKKHNPLKKIEWPREWKNNVQKNKSSEIPN